MWTKLAWFKPVHFASIPVFMTNGKQMKKCNLVVILTLLFMPAFTQNTRVWLAKTLGSADTVWLISHRDLPKNQTEPLLANGRLNPLIIIRQMTLTRSLRDSLIGILTATIESDKVEETLCYDPHQTILWSKSGSISYIDCCFQCLRYRASPDLTQLQGKNFGRRKWELLQGFFERPGLD